MMNVIRLLSMILLLSAVQQNPSALAQERTPAPSTMADDSVAAMTEDLKEAMLEMTKDMHGIVSEIGTVEDVQEADEKIGEIFDELVENMRGAVKTPTVLQALETATANDPELVEWSARMDGTMNQLEIDHPEAAAELERVMQKHSMKLMALMTEAMQNMNPEEFQEMTESADAAVVTIEEAGFDADETIESMLRMNEDMFEIIEGIESVEDVQQADRAIGEIFEELAEHMRSGMQNPTEMQKMEMEMEQNPKMQEWDQKINAAMEALRTEHPEAAAELDRVMQKHSQKIQQVMMEAAQQMQEQ